VIERRHKRERDFYYGVCRSSESDFFPNEHVHTDGLFFYLKPSAT